MCQTGLANKNLRVCDGPNLHKDGRLVLRLNGLVSKGRDDEYVHSAEIVKQVASLFRLDRKRISIPRQELEGDRDAIVVTRREPGRVALHQQAAIVRYERPGRAVRDRDERSSSHGCALDEERGRIQCYRRAEKHRGLDVDGPIADTIGIVAQVGKRSNGGRTVCGARSRGGCESGDRCQQQDNYRQSGSVHFGFLQGGEKG
jgi:hypothetical protein